MSILSVEDVKYTYRTKYQVVYALKGVSWTFEPARFYAIVGPSGCGKTTLLSLLAGLDLPTEGAISFRGTPTSKLDRDDYRLNHVSVIYQNFNLLTHLTMLENAAYPVFLRGGARKEAEEEAARRLLAVGLRQEQFRSYPNMLSGGEQQRVAIARALTAGSEIILADEPTGNLDTENTEKIVEILKELAHDQGRCVITVTHDAEIAGQADEILRLRSGCLV